MSRREAERQKFRLALVPGLLLSAVAHALLLGLGTIGVPLPGETEPAERERSEQPKERAIEAVTVRPEPTRTADGRTGSVASRGGSAEATATASAPRVRASPSPGAAMEPVEAPSVVVAVRTERTEEERLSATDLAGLFPGGNEMPKPASRAAREASGEAGNAGDQFPAVGDRRRAASRGSGCVIRPGTAINRRFPEGITIGGN